eukprot:905395-Rhodomonas_salina.1
MPPGSDPRSVPDTEQSRTGGYPHLGWIAPCGSGSPLRLSRGGGEERAAREERGRERKGALAC